MLTYLAFQAQHLRVLHGLRAFHVILLIGVPFEGSLRVGVCEGYTHPASFDHEALQFVHEIIAEKDLLTEGVVLTHVQHFDIVHVKTEADLFNEHRVRFMRKQGLVYDVKCGLE